MKILFIGDCSNYHSTVADTLARMGHQVTVASDGDRWLATHRDIDLSRRKGKFGGAALHLRLKFLEATSLRGYDVVQLCGPGFLNLRPARQWEHLKTLKKHNGKILMTALGNDSLYVRTCLDGTSGLPYTEWDHRSNDATPWLDKGLAEYEQRVYDNVDGIVTALYEYHKVLATHRPDIPLTYAGIPIDTSLIVPASPSPVCGPLTVMLTCQKGREAEKGADVLWQVTTRLSATLPPDSFRLERPDNVPYNQFPALLGTADIVLDQLYSMTPATTALLTMAQGHAPVTGGHPDYYKFIGEDILRPIIHTQYPDIHILEQSLANLIGTEDGRHRLQRMQRDAVEFVKKHNDARVVANKFLKAWT